MALSRLTLSLAAAAILADAATELGELQDQRVVQQVLVAQVVVERLHPVAECKHRRCNFRFFHSVAARTPPEWSKW